jgi:hypothetical protein
VQRVGDAWLSPWMGRRMHGGGAGAERRSDEVVQGQAQCVIESGWPRAEPNRAWAWWPTRWSVEEPGGTWWPTRGLGGVTPGFKAKPNAQSMCA